MSPEELQEAIKEAQHDGYYKQVYDLIGDANNLKDAISNMEANVDGKYPIDDLKTFLENNEFAFWTDNGDRVPLGDIDTSTIKYGWQGKNKTTNNVSTSTASETNKNTINNTTEKNIPQKENSYKSKNTGGRKQRRKERQEQKRQKRERLQKEENVRETIKEKAEANYEKANANINNNDNVSQKPKNPVYRSMEDIMGDTTFEEFKERADNIRKEYDDKKRVDNVLDGIFDIIDGSADEKELQDRMSKYAKKSGLDKENRAEIHEFIHENADDILKKTKKEGAEQATENVVKKGTKEGIEELGESNLKKIFNKRVFGVAFSGVFAINDYKTAREEGKGVARSALRAGAQFVEGEVLGAAMIPIGLAKAAPMMAIKGVETAQSMTRQMNSVQRLQTFGNTHFQDTQQLATMRQSGMELAKMSQYNLQQAIMGNEAQYMHK